MIFHIGTSGWSYHHWKGNFYPDDLSNDQMLDFYQQHFNCVEINNSFYHLPEKKTLLHWYDCVPDDFIFSVKASRYITHMKKLKDPATTLPPFFERVQLLADKLGPILFQLPPHWHVNCERLAGFLDTLPSNYRYTFEFRDPSWHCQEVYELLCQHNSAFCIFDLDRQLSPKQITAEFIYIRLHGPQGPYQGQYNTKTLAAWADAFSNWVKQRKEIFCFFDNDEAGYAAQDAKRLIDMLIMH